MCRRAGLEHQTPLRLDGSQPAERARLPVWVRKTRSNRILPEVLRNGGKPGTDRGVLVRRRLGGFRIDELPARLADAFLVLEQELEREIKDGQQHTRHFYDLFANYSASQGFDIGGAWSQPFSGGRQNRLLRADSGGGNWINGCLRSSRAHSASFH